MKKTILTREELMAGAGIQEADLFQWEQAKLIQPAGSTDGHIPFYSEQNVAEVNQILQLRGLGYDLEAIQKIVKKVGLPQDIQIKDEKSKGKNFLTVGSLAEKIGVSPRTLKHWEDKGIIIPDMRSEGGFRLYGEHYVYLCQLIQDLQLFGYSLDQIKTISNYFQTFLALNTSLENESSDEVQVQLSAMADEIEQLSHKINQYKKGIQRWEELLKKKRKEVQNLKNQNQKRMNQKKDKKNG